jgi:transposase
VLMLPPSVKIHVATSAVDMRKSFDALAGLVSSVLEEDPLSGHLFVFFNRRRDLVKVLWWSNGGLCLFAKRLEQGCFRWARPVDASARHVEIPAADLALLLEGVDLGKARRQRWWNPAERLSA